jgi:hypothetical protein
VALANVRMISMMKYKGQNNGLFSFAVPEIICRK